MSDYDITVCIPVYNSEDCIERAIRSILDQDVDAKVEILLCDDGSADGSVAIIERLQADHDNIRLIQNDRNHGRPYTRNRLIAEAAGELMTWLDSDDEKYPTMLGHQYNTIRRIEKQDGKASLKGLLVFTNFDWLWPHADKPKLMEPPEADYHMEQLLNANFGGYLWLMMGTAETFRIVGGFDEKLPRLQDLDFFIRFVQKGGRLVRIEDPSPQCIYYKDDQARGAWQVWQSWNHIWKKHRLHYCAYGYKNALNWRLHHYRVARRFAKNNNDNKTYYVISAQQALFMMSRKIRSVIGV